MFDDKKFGTIFPTRHGVATGSSNERQMLDHIGGADSFRKTYRTNADGSVTRCSTRNGMPEFVTSSPPTGGIGAPLVYLESGQLEWSYPAPLNPDRDAPATWHFLDLNTQADYLGYIYTTGGSIGAQIATQLGNLSEGQDSVAVGPPSEYLREEYADVTVMKKLVLAWYPASVFSGKLRLFMQAQYGAKEKAGEFNFTLDLMGESALLMYKGLQFGVWAHDSPGLFSASDGSFWLLVIRQVGQQYVVRSYPITHSNAVSGLVKRYKSGDYAADEKAKIEAYIFAHSSIAVDQERIVGTFDGGEVSGAMSYGWKWNSDGSEASVVTHRVVGGYGDYAFSSKTLRLAFSYNTVSKTISLTGEKTEHGDWTDGWGVFNLFIPESEVLKSPLNLYSLAMDTHGCRAPFNFSGVPIYGYYKDDVWTPITLSRSIEQGPFPIYTQNSTGLVYNDGKNAEDFTVENCYNFGFHSANQSWSYASEKLLNSTMMDISFGDFSVHGESRYGYYIEVTWDVGGMSADVANPVTFVGDQVGQGSAYTGSRPAGCPPTAYTLVGSTIKRASYVYTRVNRTSTSYKAWALCIPGLDAEAAYIATYDYRVDDSVRINQWTCASSTVWFTATGYPYGSNTIETWAYSPWCPAGTSGWYGEVDSAVQVISPVLPDPQSHIAVSCFNAVIHGEVGTPGGSYYALFNCSREHPTYDRGMFMLTSAGDRYVGSEGIKSPLSVDGLHHFVGWA